MKYRCKVDSPFGNKNEIKKEDYFTIDFKDWGYRQIYCKEYPDLFEPIEEVKCEHNFQIHHMSETMDIELKLYRCLKCGEEKQDRIGKGEMEEVKCERRYNHSWSKGSPCLNQEFDNIYAILEGMRK